MKTIQPIGRCALIAAALLSLASCDKNSGVNENPFDDDTPTTERTYYYNPIINASIPDPTVIRGTNGAFYLMGTEDIRNMIIYKSTNMVTWSRDGYAFTEATRPTFIPDGMMWAPEANYIGGRYVLYYSLANTSSGRFAVGVATSSNPDGPYHDQGKLIEQGVDVSTGGTCIDEFVYSEDGHNYMFYGSYGGIYWIELTENGLAVLNGTPQQFASSEYEGTMIHKHGDYYYFFGSLNGYQSNYKLAVARSTSLFGPYYNKSGKTTMEGGGYEVVFSGNKSYSNTGHCSRIFTDDGGNDWIFLHAYTVTAKNSSRYPHLYKVTWDEEGWPVIGDNGHPSNIVNELPVINR